MRANSAATKGARRGDESRQEPTGATPTFTAQIQTPTGRGAHPASLSAKGYPGGKRRTWRSPTTWARRPPTTRATAPPAWSPSSRRFRCALTQGPGCGPEPSWCVRPADHSARAVSSTKANSRAHTQLGCAPPRVRKAPPCTLYPLTQARPRVCSAQAPSRRCPANHLHTRDGKKTPRAERSHGSRLLHCSCEEGGKRCNDGTSCPPPHAPFLASTRNGKCDLAARTHPNRIHVRDPVVELRLMQPRSPVTEVHSACSCCQPVMKSRHLSQ